MSQDTTTTNTGSCYHTLFAEIEVPCSCSRVAIFDMDMTLIQMECFDEMARSCCTCLKCASTDDRARGINTRSYIGDKESKRKAEKEGSSSLGKNEKRKENSSGEQNLQQQRQSEEEEGEKDRGQGCSTESPFSYASNSHCLFEEVESVTRGAMEKNLNFLQSMEDTVRVFKGQQALPIYEAVTRKALKRITRGAPELIDFLLKRGFFIVVASGGFLPMARCVARHLGIHACFSNTYSTTCTSSIGNKTCSMTLPRREEKGEGKSEEKSDNKRGMHSTEINVRLAGVGDQPAIQHDTYSFSSLFSTEYAAGIPPYNEDEIFDGKMKEGGLVVTGEVKRQVALCARHAVACACGEADDKNVFSVGFGDGSNDIPFLSTVDCGFGFNAKEFVRHALKDVPTVNFIDDPPDGLDAAIPLIEAALKNRID